MGSSLALTSPNQELVPFPGLISVNTMGLIVVIFPKVWMATVTEEVVAIGGSSRFLGMSALWSPCLRKMLVPQ